MSAGWGGGAVAHGPESDGKRDQGRHCERARFAYHPEHAAPGDALLGRFGRRVPAGRCSTPPASGVRFNMSSGEDDARPAPL